MPRNNSAPQEFTQSRFMIDLDRIMKSAAIRRDILQRAGIKRLRWKRILSVLAGVMALVSAGAIAGVIAKVFGDSSAQLLAALAAAVSGTISLVTNAFLTDDEIVAMLAASSKYLLLRENIRRIQVHPSLSDEERFSRLEHFQQEYGELDATFSRFFPEPDRDSGSPSRII